MSAWQPIETAPKDGTPVDVWAYGDQADASFYCGPFFRRRRGGTFEGRITDVAWTDGWRPCLGLTRAYRLNMTPTHWMPRPPAPAADKTI